MGDVIAPLQSQAGAVNFKRSTGKKIGGLKQGLKIMHFGSMQDGGPAKDACKIVGPDDIR